MDSEIEKTLHTLYNKEYEDETIRDEEIMRVRQQLIRKVLQSDCAEDKKNQYIQKILLFSNRSESEELNEQKPDEIIDNEYISESLRTWHDEEKSILGCKHYNRGATMQCPECNKFFTCRQCHDEHCSHSINRYNVKYMACMYCLRIQETAQYCKYCNKQLGDYYCDICHFWENTALPSFHCPHCNICRRGKGLDIDVFHCFTCNCCIPMTNKDDHLCRENSLFCDCPICGEFLQTSVKDCVVLKCRHAIHYTCLLEYLNSNYICPICQKTIIEPEEYFAQIDEFLKNNPMPEEYRGLRRKIFCNDCEKYNEVDYHFAYNKCPNCKSYNTKVVKS